MQEISQKARQVLEYLTQRESSIPPTVREIGAALQIKSTSTVHKYLTELAAAGYIEKGDKMNRAISLPQQQSAKVPLLGVVTAGQPILAVEDIEGYVPYQGGRYPANELFALRVRGESMIEAGIISGDIILQGKRALPPAAGKQHHGAHYCGFGADPGQGGSTAAGILRRSPQKRRAARRRVRGATGGSPEESRTAMPGKRAAILKS